eukprot:gene17111-21813_t
MGKLLISHRYNFLSLLPSGPGEVQKELIVQDLPVQILKKASESRILDTNTVVACNTLAEEVLYDNP